MESVKIFLDDIVTAKDMPNGHTRITIKFDSSIYCCVTDYYHASMRDRGYIIIRYDI
jgi:hypothetical protein